MLATALLLVVAAQEPAAFDLASLSPHLNKNVAVAKTDKTIVTGQLVEVGRDSIVIAAPFGENTTREVLIFAAEIESFRLAAPTPAPTIDPQESSRIVTEAAAARSRAEGKIAEAAWMKQQRAAERDAEARAEAESRDHGAAAGGWLINGSLFGIAGAVSLGTWAFVFGTPALLIGGGVACVVSAISLVVAALENGASQAAHTEAEAHGRRADAMAY